MKEFDYDLDYAHLDFRRRPDLYRIGRGEQGVLLVEPYKSEILPHWRFKTVSEARTSATAIYGLYRRYLLAEDFVGMDMARKFLQMGFTRARRYANHLGGRKYDRATKRLLPRTAPDPEKAAAAEIFRRRWELVRKDPAYVAARAAHRERFERWHGSCTRTPNSDRVWQPVDTRTTLDKEREFRAAARSARLRYVSDAERGFARRRRGKAFTYVRPSGEVLRDRATIARIRALAIPPAWKDVWICPAADGHLQATGRDARGRKQYRYHPRWREAQDDHKYERIIAFAKTLPKIRRAVARHLRLRGLPREKVLAAAVRLLETTLIRVGNDEYARDNQSFGLTTMHDKHVKVRGATIRFDFRGKHGIKHEIDLKDRRLAAIVHACRELPGQELFQYLDEAGEVCDVGSGDVNDYLRTISGEDFTAKDFRTWAGTALAAQALQEFEDFDSTAAAKRNITKAIERVAERLGNTQAICRKSYVHPAVIEAYMDRSLVKTLKRQTERELRNALHRLSSEEAAVLALLQQRMEQELTGRKRRSTNILAKPKRGARRAKTQRKTQAKK